MTEQNKAFRLDGKVALVTGAARGIGAEIARTLAQAGAAIPRRETPVRVERHDRVIDGVGNDRWVTCNVVDDWRGGLFENQSPDGSLAIKPRQTVHAFSF